MIAYLKGTVLEKGKDFAVVLAGDIGYKVNLATSAALALEKGGVVRLYTHQVIRDDAHELYGFAQMKELEFFWKLTGVSGVGPKMAMHLLALGVVDSVSRAIEQGDVEYLSSAQGVGKKTAQRVVLELRGKLVGDDDVSGEVSEAVSALENLGYPRAKARAIVTGLPDGITTEEKIKLALRQLSR
jgi:Holliday junction DNA helicase RuvA